MILGVDLHIHSCLSPCAEDEMTPNNLVNMAWLQGIQALAVTDHNTAKNIPACAAIAKERGLLLLPGIEVTTREDVHCLCYFEAIDAALAFGEMLYEHLGEMPNVPRLFGNQWIMDAEDQIIAEEPRLLLQATTLSLGDLARKAHQMGGIAVPAHINRGSNGLLVNLGMLPLDPPFPTLEVSGSVPMPPCDLSRHTLLHASDAHRLEAIAPPPCQIDLEKPSMTALFQYIRQGKGSNAMV